MRTYVIDCAVRFLATSVSLLSLLGFCITYTRHHFLFCPVFVSGNSPNFSIDSVDVCYLCVGEKRKIGKITKRLAESRHTLQPMWELHMLHIIRANT